MKGTKRMQDFNIKALNGPLTIEVRTDGGIGICYDTDDAHNTLMLDKEQFISMMGWLITYLESHKNG